MKNEKSERKFDFRPMGLAIKKAREKKGMTQEQLADIIGRSLEPMPSSRCRINRFFICLRVSARFLHGFCTVSKRAKDANRCKIRQRVQKFETQNLRCIAKKRR